MKTKTKKLKQKEKKHQKNKKTKPKRKNNPPKTKNKIRKKERTKKKNKTKKEQRKTKQKFYEGFRFPVGRDLYFFERSCIPTAVLLLGGTGSDVNVGTKFLMGSSRRLPGRPWPSPAGLIRGTASERVAENECTPVFLPELELVES